MSKYVKKPYFLPPKITGPIDYKKLSAKKVEELKFYMTDVMRRLYEDLEISAFIRWRKYFQQLAPFFSWHDDADNIAIIEMIDKLKSSLKNHCLLVITKCMMKKTEWFSWKMYMLQYRKGDLQLSFFQEKYFDAILLDEKKQRLFGKYLTHDIKADVQIYSPPENKEDGTRQDNNENENMSHLWRRMEEENKRE